MNTLRFERFMVQLSRAWIVLCFLVVSSIPQGTAQSATAPATVQNFDVIGVGSPCLLNPTSTGFRTPVVVAGGPGGSGKMLRLASRTLPVHQGMIAFDRTASGAFAMIVAEFDFRITIGTGRADGLGFTLLNTANYGATGVAFPGSPWFVAEEPNFTGSLGIGFDTYWSSDIGDVSNNHLSLHFNRASLRQFDLPPGLDLASGQWIHAKIIMRPGRNLSDVSVILTKSGGAPVTVINRFKVPGFTPYDARVQLAARSGGLTSDHDIDNIRVCFLNPAPPPADFNGDRVTDVGIYRPSQGMWYVKDQFALKHGLPGDIPVPCDYDRDGDVDVAVYRPSTGIWFVKDQFTAQHGLPGAGDIPVPADYDGDRDCDVTVFRSSTGSWYAKGLFSVNHGATGDIPVPGDYDGDGDADVAVYSPASGMWNVKDQFTVNYGIPGDIPVPGDYDGDGDTDLAIYRPSDGRWYVKDQFITKYGILGDIPVPGDYDRDGDTDLAIYRPSQGMWYVKDQFIVKYGLSTDFPLPARDTNGDGDPYQ